MPPGGLNPPPESHLRVAFLLSHTQMRIFVGYARVRMP